MGVVGEADDHIRRVETFVSRPSAQARRDSPPSGSRIDDGFRCSPSYAYSVTAPASVTTTVTRSDSS